VRGAACGVVRVALTGNIASGKSAVTDDVWRRNGAYVIDADELARRAVEPGTSGPCVASPNCSAGRSSHPTARSTVPRCGGIVFATNDAAPLEAILHPEVERLRQKAERAWPWWRGADVSSCTPFRSCSRPDSSRGFDT
jgi:dephospho-CoA kinase